MQYFYLVRNGDGSGQCDQVSLKAVVKDELVLNTRSLKNEAKAVRFQLYPIFYTIY
jgi:hypothetical protein